MPTFDWRDLAPHEHALAFTVAKTAGFDVLNDLRAAIRRAVVDQVPFERFRDELIPTLVRKGWWGRQEAQDPVTGAKVLAQLGSPRRLQVMYWANVHSAHAAGKWERIERTKDFLPFLTYVGSVSERRRPLHVSWIGTTLPVDDLWWRTHYPPNGWNCKCSVRQVADRERERILQRGGRDKAPALAPREWINKKTGEVETVPAGIDPGWQSNPGIMRDKTITRQLQGALDRMPEAARREVVKSLIKHPVFEYVVNNRAGFIYPHPAGDSGNQAKGHFGAVVATLPEALQVTIQSMTSIVRLSVSDAAKQLEKRKRKDGTLLFGVDDYRIVQAMLDAPEEVAQDRGKWRVKASVEGKAYLAVFKHVPQTGELFLNSFRRDD